MNKSISNLNNVANKLNMMFTVSELDRISVMHELFDKILLYDWKYDLTICNRHMCYTFAFRAISKSNDNRLYLYDYDHTGQDSNIVNTTIDIHIHLFRLVSEYIDFDQVERLQNRLNALYEHDKTVNRINLETVNIDKNYIKQCLKHQHEYLTSLNLQHVLQKRLETMKQKQTLDIISKI